MLFHTSKKPVQLQIIHLNKIQKTRQEALKSASESDKKSLKKRLCKCKKDIQKTTDKSKALADKSDARKVYVLDFDGDIKASAVNHLREEISAIISTAKAGDEVVVRLESGGGQVHAYGLAAAQLARIKQAKLVLTVCVDKIAASGGYMMACTADKIIASDFAVIGSVGVVSQMPNFHDFLKKHDVNVELFTAGEYKRTVTMFGENDEKGRLKYQEELSRIHELFKSFIKTHRPSLEVEKIATGEFWFGTDALANGLVDEIGTSDAYLLALLDECDVFALHSKAKPTLAEKLGLAEQMSLGGFIQNAAQSIPEALAKLSRP